MERSFRSLFAGPVYRFRVSGTIGERAVLATAEHGPGLRAGKTFGPEAGLAGAAFPAWS